MPHPILTLPRRTKQAIVVVVDALSGVLAMWLALAYRLGTLDPTAAPSTMVYAVAPVLALPVFVHFGLYLAVFRYTGLGTLLTIAKATAAYGVVLLVALLALPLGAHWSVGLMQPVLLLTFVVGSRTIVRYWFGTDRAGRVPTEHRPRLLIYGAGATGAAAKNAAERGRQFTIVGFLEDDDSLVGRHINGHPIHSARQLGELVSQYSVSDVLLAMPSISRARRNEILTRLRAFQLHVRTVSPNSSADPKTWAEADIQELDVEDLLGRDSVPPQARLLERHNRGCLVLVTGAGGSIGSELCRQLLTVRPRTLLLFDHSEFLLYSIHSELCSLRQAMESTVEIVPLLGSVTDAQRLGDVCSTWRPDIVYHAAAYKHVPMVEHNPAEGLRNNVFGTLTAAAVAMQHGVKHFVLVSTDKAVRPTNVMGASKRLAELVLQALADGDEPRFELPGLPRLTPRHRTRFCMVRFGNVLGSSGSVVPLFRQQIRSGGPLTVTHPEVTRYFMTIREAAQLVIQAGAMAEGGDVFVLDMGQPIRIGDLARRMVELSGMTVKDADHPDGDIELVFTGLRPGEKLYEELLIGDQPGPTAHPRIMKAREEFVPWPELQRQLRLLDQFIERNDVEGMRELMAGLVNGYRPADEVVDWVHLARDAAHAVEDERSASVERPVAGPRATVARHRIA